MGKNLYTALLKAQKEMGPVYKNATNPAFRSKYAALDSVIETVSEPLNNNGLVFFQPMDFDEEGNAILETRIVHADTGESISSRAKLVAKDMNDPQKIGGSITYFRRYQLLSMLGIAPEDDDGNTAAGKTPAAATARPSSPSEAQVNFAKKLMADVRGAKTKKAADELSKQLTGKPFDQLTGFELSKKIIDPLKAEQGGPGF